MSAWTAPRTALLCTFLGCDPPPATTTAHPLPLRMPEDLADCDQTPYAEVRDTCVLGFAVRATNDGREAITWDACAAVQSPLWRDECHFLVAETLGHRGDLAKALDHCTETGSFARNCFTHATWGERPFSGTESPSDVGAADRIGRMLAQVERASRNPGEPEYRLGLDMLRASVWFKLYYGSGLADPAAARSATGPDRVDGRTAFAWEVFRLLDADIGMADRIATVLAVWQGDMPPPSGPGLPHRCWRGRNTRPTVLAQLADEPLAHTPHYGLRLVGESDEDDLVIATLEAAHFDLRTSSGAFVEQLRDSRPRVRWTAARLELMLKPETDALYEEIARAAPSWTRAEKDVLRNSARPPWSARRAPEGCP